jgi:hypothetical protein
MNIPSDNFIERFKNTEGAFSVCEAIALYNIADSAPGGTYCELGSYLGKSAMTAASVLKNGIFYLLDPIYLNGEMADKLVENITPLVNSEIFLLPVAETSEYFLPLMKDLSYVMVDSGSHGDGLPMREVKLLEDKMISGGIIAFHDYGNQFTEVIHALGYLLSTGKYKMIEINWAEIFDYVRGKNLEEGNKTWHGRGSNDFPCYLGAVHKT